MGATGREVALVELLVVGLRLPGRVLIGGHDFHLAPGAGVRDLSRLERPAFIRAKGLEMGQQAAGTVGTAPELRSAVGA